MNMIAGSSVHSSGLHPFFCDNVAPNSHIPYALEVFRLLDGDHLPITDSLKLRISLT